MIDVNYFHLNVKTQDYKMGRANPKEFINLLNTEPYFAIDKSLVYDVALDQSNSCTGVTIEDINGKTLLMFEVVNRGLAFEYYRKALITLLSQVLNGITIRYSIMEEPLPFVSGRHNPQLTALKKLLVSFFESDKVNNQTHSLVKPQSWRAGLINKDNPNPARSKMATVHEIIKMYPLTEHFIEITYNPTNDSGFDGFESCGILHGFLQRHEVNNDNNVVKIIGPKNTTKMAEAFFCYCDSNLTDVQNLVSLLEQYNPKLGTPRVKYYNEEETVYGNIKMSLVDDFTLTEITKPIDKLSILIRFGLTVDDSKSLYMIVVPSSKIKPNVLAYLDSLNLNMEKFY